jgi:hypothetical protein
VVVEKMNSYLNLVQTIWGFRYLLIKIIMSFYFKYIFYAHAVPEGISKFKPNESSSGGVTFCPGNNWLVKRVPLCCWLRTPTNALSSFLVNSVTPLFPPRFFKIIKYSF